VCIEPCGLRALASADRPVCPPTAIMAPVGAHVSGSGWSVMAYTAIQRQDPSPEGGEVDAEVERAIAASGGLGRASGRHADMGWKRHYPFTPLQ
jgi:hypothetical protein